MGIEANSVFWSEMEEYHNLVKEYDRNIEMYHPGSVNSKRMCPCLKFSHWCSWAATSVKYYRHNGPRF